MKEIVIIGGGLSGLVNAILLNRAGFPVRLFEEKKYPFHRVCGEYISNEVLSFLRHESIYPSDLSPVPISKFHLTSPSGKSLKIPLDLGGFGLSRYAFDEWLYHQAINEGVQFHFDRVVSCVFEKEKFTIKTREELTLEADIVIGSFGKRSTLDKTLQRAFINKRYPYIGVKYHIETDHVADDVVELHNFRDGYCGISRIEEGKFNLCYLSHRNNLKKQKSIPEMEKNVLSKNPHLSRIFNDSQFLFEKPEVINEISFEPKEPVHNHMLMSGDSAGMITPLCGNGMAMAIHSAKTLSDLIISNVEMGFNRDKLEIDYTSTWKQLFARRLWAGRKIQHLFGSPMLSEFAVGISSAIPTIARYLMKKTHGVPF